MRPGPLHRSDASRRASEPRRGGAGFRTAALAALVALALAAGCSHDPGQPGPNGPPETGLVFVGDVDTTLYIQEIRWWGSDTDGEVVGFYYRWVPSQPVPGFDTTWTFTTAASKSFTLPTPTGDAGYTFYVSAQDEFGVLDPTPAFQAYPFRNAAPACSLTTVDAPAFPDTLFPSFTLFWTASDPDGDATLARFLIWTDATAANPIVIENGAARAGALGPSDFAEFGDQRIYLQAVDSGQRGSAPDTFSAYLLGAAAPVLLVDDSPSSEFGPADAFYATNVEAFFGPGNYDVLDIERFPVESTEQARALLDAYETVVWYDQVSDTLGSPSLAAARDALPDWIAAGGRILVVSTYVVGTNLLNINPVSGSGDTIPEAFYPDFDPRFRRVSAGVDRLLSNGRQILGTYDVLGNAAYGLGTLRHSAFANASLDVFVPTDDAVALYTIPAGTVIAADFDTLKEEGTVGILQSSGTGRLVLMGFPFWRMQVYANHNCEFRAVLCVLTGSPPCPCPPP
jgi:hypothetical protein